MPLDDTTPADTALLSTHAGEIRSLKTQLNTVEASVLTALPGLEAAANADTSPSVADTIALVTANAGATTITYLDDGYEGQFVMLIAGDANTTIQHDAGLIQLKGQADIKLVDGEAICLVLEDSIWREVGGFPRTNFKTITAAAYSALTNDSAIIANAGSNGITITMPLASDVTEGYTIKIKKSDSTANVVTIQRQSSDYIDSGTSIQLTLEGESVTLISDGATTWYKFN